MTPAIKTRFAPSPTGPLHIGGVRTALFNYLFARRGKGQFFLRMEDTDRERSKPEYEKDIIDSIQWLGLEWDGEIVRQSSRLGHYRNFANMLIEKGSAYEQEGAVRFRIPKIKVAFCDLVHGQINFDSALFDDYVILKSDGFPAYNFACVIDDHEMNMTHVIRGDDHISNTPRQILLYQAFGWAPPQFAHLPLVLGRDSVPLSKRDAVVDLHSYQNDGYLPDALLNYLALLGWSPGGNKEFIPRQDLVRQFDLKDVNKTGAMFDLAKLKWLNSEHLKRMPEEEYVRVAETYLKTAADIADGCSHSMLRDAIILARPRIQIIKDLAGQLQFFLNDFVTYDPEAVQKYIKQDKITYYFSALIEALQVLADFSDEKRVESVLRQVAGELKIEARELIHPARVALTGKAVSPSLFSVMRILGKVRTLDRFQKTIDTFGGKQAGE